MKSTPSRRQVPIDPASSHEDAPLLTAAQVRGWKADLEADEILLAELPARIAEKRRRFEAAMVFVTPWMHDAIFGEADSAEHKDEPLELTNFESRRFKAERGGQSTWTGIIMDVLDKADTGLSHAQLIEALASSDTPHAKQLPHNTKAYYSAVSKLERRKELIRLDGFLYANDVLERLQQEGAELPKEQPMVEGPKEYTSAWFVRRALLNAPDGLTAVEIKKAIKDEDGVTPKLYSSNNFIFNVLKSLQVSGLITKNDASKKYFALQKR